MEKCYEYLGCSQKDCVMYNDKSGKNCWEVEGTLCNNQSTEFIKMELGEKEKCKPCIYYKMVTKYKLK